MTVAQRMTADEYLATTFDERWVELIDGEVVVNEPRWPHNAASVRLLLALGGWIDAAPRRGAVAVPLDVRLDERNVYAPDILWYADGRVPDADSAWPYPVPDLAIEIRSPSTWRYDVGTKKSVYERENLPELWLVDLDAGVVLAFRRSSPRATAFDVALELPRGDALASPLLPGFALALAELFPSA